MVTPSYMEPIVIFAMICIDNDKTKCITNVTTLYVTFVLKSLLADIAIIIRIQINCISKITQ
jgi:hypothetical protein